LLQPPVYELRRLGQAKVLPPLHLETETAGENNNKAQAVNSRTKRGKK